MNEPQRRRSGDFVERISIILIIGAFLGGYLVLIDPQIELHLGDHIVKFGREGFASEVKGMVLQSMLISGFAAVVTYWVGNTKQGQEQAQSVSRIAETVPVAAAVAASVLPGSATPGASVAAMDVKAETVNLTEEKPK